MLIAPLCASPHKVVDWDASLRFRRKTISANASTALSTNFITILLSKTKKPPDGGSPLSFYSAGCSDSRHWLVRQQVRGFDT
jgi:hypothetical protein